MTGAAVHPALPPWESLSLPAQVAQMIVVRASGYLFDHQRPYPQWEAPNADLQGWLGEVGLGGVILLGGSAAEVGRRVQQLQSWSAIPLLVAADIEEGVGQRFAGATVFPPPMALGAIAATDLPQAIALATAFGAATAQEALAIGLNWLLAPVVDVNHNPANPVINVRAFGTTPERVAPLTTAFIQGARRHPILTTAKHFPGHGDTATDSHLDLPVLPHALPRLDQVELPPFRAAIAAGVDAVMTAHLSIPALDVTYPATLSPAILTGMLRQELGFDGLIVTDALIMGAIAQRYGANEAVVLAIAAGADVILMPADPLGAIHAVCDAVAEGRIPVERIQAAVARIWRAKAKIGTPFTLYQSSGHAWEHLPPPPIQLDALAQPAVRSLAREILLRSQISPVQPLRVETTTPRRNLILVDRVWACSQLTPTAPAIALPMQWGYDLQIWDAVASTQNPTQDPALVPTLLQCFIRGNPFRGSASQIEFATAWLLHLLQHQALLGLVIYGSPYVLETWRSHLPDDLPVVFTYGQDVEAQQIALAALCADQQWAGRGDRQFTT